MAEGAVLLRGAALPFENELLGVLHGVTATSRFRHMITPGGYTMSVAMTNCGAAGWVTDRTGYRYDGMDPETGNPWPPMPDCFLDLAVAAAMEAGYPEFRPDSCLINRYEPGARLSLHQDKNERDFADPIVSVSLGLPATFQFGGLKRNDPVKKFALRHGDIVVWGGPSRLRYHGVVELKDGHHDTGGRLRLNLTFRWPMSGRCPAGISKLRAVVRTPRRISEIGPRQELHSVVFAAASRPGRRTALTLPLLPPPQKNRSPPSDSSPETPVPGGISSLSKTFPVWGSTRLISLSSPSQVPCHMSPSTQVTPVTNLLDSMVRRIEPV